MNNWYIRKYNWFCQHSKAAKVVIFTCKFLSYIIYFSYIFSVLFLFIQKKWNTLIPFLLVPATGFILETVIRAKINAPRPYEVLKIPPLDKKDTKGQSFPSRHAFSAAILSIAFYTLHPMLGCILILFTIIIGLCRILMGVHWTKDVCVGLLFGWFYGLIGFFFFH